MPHISAPLTNSRLRHENAARPGITESNVQDMLREVRMALL
jgi:signal recognition particle GTPase